MTTLGQQIAALSTWVDRANAHRDPEAQEWGRIGKIGEEFGEVIEAYIGLTGQNPRKGTTHTADDVLKELLDVAVTALGAWEHLTGNTGRVMAEFDTFVDGLVKRAGITS